MSTEVLLGEVVFAGTVFAGDLVVPGHCGEVRDLVLGWLIACAKTPETVRSYTAGIDLWLGFCDRAGVDPLDARKPHTDAWLRMLAVTPSTRTGRPPSPGTLAQRIAVVASWYDYLVDSDVLDRSPVRRRGRPKAPAESTTVGLSRSEAAALRARCREHEVPLDRAVLVTLLGCGLRVSELVGLDLGDVQPREGETVLQVHGKGGKTRLVVCGAEAVDAITVMVEQRAAGRGVPGDELPVDEPLFATAGGARLAPRAIARLVQRVARAAGITSWAMLSPHSLRHAFATLQLDAGVPIDRVQDSMGHAHTNTTRRYDRARGRVSRSGAHILEKFLAEAEPPRPTPPGEAA